MNKIDKKLRKATTILEEFCLSFDDSYKREKITTFTIDKKDREEVERLMNLIDYDCNCEENESDFIDYFVPHFNYPIRINLSEIDPKMKSKCELKDNPLYYITFRKEDLELWNNIKNQK
jgi:hypothetical protein